MVPNDVARDETEERVIDLTVLGNDQPRASTRVAVELRCPRATEGGLANNAPDEPARGHGLDRLGFHVTDPARSHERGIVDHVPYLLRRCSERGGAGRATA